MCMVLRDHDRGCKRAALLLAALPVCVPGVAHGFEFKVSGQIDRVLM